MCVVFHQGSYRICNRKAVVFRLEVVVYRLDILKVRSHHCHRQRWSNHLEPLGRSLRTCAGNVRVSVEVMRLLNECPGFCLKRGLISERFGCAAFEFANLSITKSEAKWLLYAIEVRLDPWFLGVSNNGLNITSHVGPFWCPLWPKRLTPVCL